jgi:hypothetical protein
MFEDDFARGIIPHLFAEVPMDAEASLLSHLEQSRRDVMKLQRIFLAPENVAAVSAIQVAEGVNLKNLYKFLLTWIFSISFVLCLVVKFWFCFVTDREQAKTG